MFLHSLVAVVHLLSFGSSSSERIVHFEPRVGLRASSGDLSPEVGLGVEAWIAALSWDPWIRPFRWDRVVQDPDGGRSKYHELMYGSTLGFRLRTPGRGGWIAASGGWEWIAGDWAGTRASPTTEVVPWVGFEAKSSSNLLGRIRVATESNRLDWVRFEILGAFSLPKN